MARDTLIVTGADDRYAALMREMLLSVRTHRESAGIDIGVLDCGLSAENCDWCRSFGATVVQPGWDVTFGAGLDVAPSFRAMTARPHLRRYFPGYEIYIWLDADVWVQDWSAIALLSASCNLGDVALIPEVHRSYRNFRDGRDDFETANGQAYAEAFGKAAAAQLIRRPLNNAGVFAMTSTSAAWELWAGLLSDAARRSANMIDQIARLEVALHPHRFDPPIQPRLIRQRKRLRRQDNHRDMRGFGIVLELFQQREAVHIRHGQIADHQIGAALAHQIKAIQRVVGFKDAIVLIGVQQAADQAAVLRVVVNDHNGSNLFVQPFQRRAESFFLLLDGGAAQFQIKHVLIF